MRALLILALLIFPQAEAPTLAAFGDSITVGNLASTESQTYAHLTADALGLALDNRAVSGTVVADQLETIRAYDGPAVTAIWLVCANDLTSGTTAADFGATVQAGVDVLTARGMTVYLNGACLPYPWADTTAYDAALAQITGARLVDVRTGFDAAAMLADKKHPNDAGHAFLAGAFERAMARVIYALEWHSQLPLDPATIQATVTGGTLMSAITTQDAMQGWIEATAPAACLTIDAQAFTTTGVLVRFVRSWDAQCQRVYLPIVAQ